ncbi:MAG: FAD:protein FMN transferase [Oscillospiraceae bacterium]
MKRIPVLLTLMIALLLVSCGKLESSAASQPVSATIFAMDTVMELNIYGDSELLKGSESLIYNLEALLSVTDENSEIFNVNHNGSAVLSGVTAELVSDALELCSRTGGALDISIYPVVRAWGFTTGEYRIPGDAELMELLKNVDYTKIRLDPKTGELTLPDGFEIDLGSVAKGYTSGRVIDYLRENGVTSALLNLGGNVHALGAKPGGSPWRIAIQDPLGDGNLCVLEITDKAVITSGGYERYFEQDGETYWHIIDPSTGRPASSGLVSVSIIGENGLLCDGLSTSLFILGLEDAAELWRESSDFEAVFVTTDGEIYITEGLEGCFETAGKYDDAEVTVIRRG